jgi:predicted XRE-type DNA-binding protein
MEITRGSDNVFEDLGLPNPEEHLAKARLTYRITTLLEESGGPSRDAAHRVGLTEAELNDLLRGRLEEFSLDDLFRMLNALGQDVEIIVRERTITGRPGSLVATTA